MSVTSSPDVLVQWDDWASRCTDRLFELDPRVQTDGTDDDRLDLAAAFLARKAIVDRIVELRAAGSGDAGRRRAAELATQPLLDDHGGAVASDLASAATLVDAILAKIERRLDGAERDQLALAEAMTAIHHDLDAAKPLVDALGIHAQRLAELTARADAAPRALDALTPLVTQVRALLADLRAADDERTALFVQLPGLPARLDALRERERAVRDVVERAREKVRPLPKLAVPSVDALAPLPSADELSAQPWPAARARLQPALATVGRLAAALDEVERRYSAVLHERDDLRGLLQSFRDKAGAHRLAEDPVLDPAFRSAQELLWSAPCDLDAARPLVQAYTEAVNAAIRARATGDQRGLG